VSAGLRRVVAARRAFLATSVHRLARAQGQSRSNCAGRRQFRHFAADALHNTVIARLVD
jgi:hypothetical protein